MKQCLSISYFLLALIVVAVLFSTRLIAATPTTTQTAPNDPLQADSFKDPKSGIEIRLPKGWILKTGIEDTGYEAPAVDLKGSGGLAPDVVFAKQAAAGIKPSDIDAIIADKLKEYATALPEYKEEVTGAARPTIAGKGIARIDCSCIPEKNLRVHDVQIWIVANDQVYVITFTSLADTYASNATIFDAMIKTIRVP